MRYELSLATLTGLLVRLGALFGLRAYRYQMSPTRGHLGFAGEVGRIGYAIASGQGFASPYQFATGPTAQQPPVYPYIVAGVFKLFGPFTLSSALALLILNCILSAAVCVTVYHVGKTVFGEKVGILSAWAWAFFPFAIFSAGTGIWPTTLSALLLSMALVWLSRLDAQASKYSWIAYGLLWGLIALTNTVCVSVLPVFVAWLCWKRRAAKRELFFATLAFLLVVTPWIVRNRVALGHWFFVRDNFGLELYWGNHEGATGRESAGINPGRDEGELRQYIQLGEWNYFAQKRAMAVQFMKRDPKRVAELTLLRFWQYWTSHAYRFNGLAQTFFAAFVDVCAFIGLALAMREKNPFVFPLGAVVVVFPVVYYLTHVNAAYRAPIEPVLVVLMVAGIARNIALWRRSVSANSRGSSDCSAGW
jgi:4-amino-4-deoxy-L-arabinose transferase-like glycosyltransferase